MAEIPLKFRADTQIPTTWKPNYFYAIYLGGGTVECYVTSMLGVPKQVGNTQMITNIVNQILQQGGFVDVQDLNNNPDKHIIAEIDGNQISETVVSLQDFELTDNTLSLTLNNEDGQQQTVTVDLSDIQTVVDLDYTSAPDKGTITNSAGDDAEIPLVDDTNAGLMSPEQKGTLETALQEVNWGDIQGDLLDQQDLIKYIGNLIPDGLVSPGVVTWSGTGFVYNVSQAVIKVGGVLYTIPAGQVTLEPSDLTLDRIDVVYATIDGFDKLTGTPSSDPVQPQVDPTSQIFLTAIIVQANTTEPDPGDIETENIYQENEEWIIGSTGTGTVNPDSTSFPFAGTKAIETTTVLNNFLLTATRGTDFNQADFDTISLQIRLKEALHSMQDLIVYLLDASGNKISQGITLQLNKSLINQYQFVALPVQNFISGIVAPRGIGIRFKVNANSGAASLNEHAGFYIDDWKLQAGIPQPNPVTEHDSLQGIKGNGTFHLSEEERDKVNSALQPNDNISELNNDAGFITLNDIPPEYFTYEQTTPSDKWTFQHPLGRKVSVTVTDSAGTVMEGQVTLNTGTEIEIEFNVPFWGYAYLI